MRPGSDATGQDEVALVPLGGRCRVTSGRDTWEIGERATIFDGQPWALYLPIGTDFTVEALTAAELAVCAARAESSLTNRS